MDSLNLEPSASWFSPFVIHCRIGGNAFRKPAAPAVISSACFRNILGNLWTSNRTLRLLLAAVLQPSHSLPNNQQALMDFNWLWPLRDEERSPRPGGASGRDLSSCKLELQGACRSIGAHPRPLEHGRGVLLHLEALAGVVVNVKSSSWSVVSACASKVGAAQSASCSASAGTIGGASESSAQSASHSLTR